MNSNRPERIERFGRLPRMAGEVWQGGLLPLPSWIEKGPDGKPYRPWAGVWVSLRTGLVNLKVEPEFGAHDPDLALEALLEFGLTRTLAGCRPERIEVIDEALGAHLLRVLGLGDLTFRLVPDLRATKQVLAHFAEHTRGKPLPPDALDVPGVSAERMRAFAEAARAFYQAAPWKLLRDEDFIQVEAPSVERSLRYLSVLGAGGELCGLGFFESPEDFEAMLAAPDPRHVEGRNRWAVWFGPIWELPFGDVELWEREGLPVAGEEAYPVALRFSPRGGIRRPDPRALAYLEGLLRALAEAGEGEIDRGRWTRRVSTFDGSKEYTLAIPALLEPLDVPPARRPGVPDRRAMERVMAEIGRFMAQSDFRDPEDANRAIMEKFGGPMDRLPSTATTPLEKAQDLMYQAFEARGRRQIQLARMALEVSPDCADAYVLLAEHASEPPRAHDLYAQGVAAGERALGPQVFADEAGHFWGIVTTRPYMRARLGLAECLRGMGRTNEAIGHYKELLRLNPNDNQGVRDILLPVLLAAGRDDEAGTLLAQYKDDVGATWKYGWALWTFRREGDGESARQRLQAARRANRHVPNYLTGKGQWPGPLPVSYSPGSEEEAVLCAEELGEAWRATPGAADWLKSPGPRKRPQTPRRRHARSR
jgi:tetratricopeptide (TPR) repeat protein